METLDLTVGRVDILSPAARALIEALNAELSARYPEEGANHFDHVKRLPLLGQHDRGTHGRSVSHA